MITEKECAVCNRKIKFQDFGSLENAKIQQAWNNQFGRFYAADLEKYHAGDEKNPHKGVDKV